MPKCLICRLKSIMRKKRSNHESDCSFVLCGDYVRLWREGVRVPYICCNKKRRKTTNVIFPLLARRKGPGGVATLCRLAATIVFAFGERGVRVPYIRCNKKRRKTTNVIFLLLARRKGLEPLTYWFVASHSIQLSYRRRYGADDEARTRYLHLGKVALYQMSYIRKCKEYYTYILGGCQEIFLYYFVFLRKNNIKKYKKTIDKSGLPYYN